MVGSYELSVLLLPSLEVAYRSSRWLGFSCTSHWQPPAAGPAGAAAEVAGLAGLAGRAVMRHGVACGAQMDISAFALRCTALRWVRRRSPRLHPCRAGGSGCGSGPVCFIPWSKRQGQQPHPACGTLRVPVPVPCALPPIE